MYIYRNLLSTALFFVVTCSVSIFYPDISKVIGIVGGLSATSIQFMVPCKIILQLFLILISNHICVNEQARFLQYVGQLHENFNYGRAKYYRIY